MSASRSAAIACAVVATVACTDAAPGSPVASVSQAITHGSADGDDPAVVALVDATGTTRCSGALVAPDVVLTAAHCLEGQTTGITDSVLIGSSVAAGGALVAVAGAVVHPSYDPAALSNDLALLVLSSPASASPLPLLTPTNAASLAGAQVRIVGFGSTAADAGDYGQKRSGTATVSSVAATTLDLAADPSQLCFGDSGGPALLTVSGTEYVAGVTSHGDTACVADDTDTRVDAYVDDFIAPFLAQCQSQGGCSYPCVPVGNPCASGFECAAADGSIAFACVPLATPARSSSCALPPSEPRDPRSAAVLAFVAAVLAARRRARSLRGRG